MDNLFVGKTLTPCVARAMFWNTVLSEYECFACVALLLSSILRYLLISKHSIVLFGGMSIFIGLYTLSHISDRYIFRYDSLHYYY